MANRKACCSLFSLATLVAFAVVTANANEFRLAISGYDPVAYFTLGKPLPGNSDFEYQWHDLRWRFATLADRVLFERDPEHYAPQYDGYCAVGVAYTKPHKDTVDPTAWTIVDGKLYLTHDHHWLGVWRKNEAEEIKQGNVNWPGVKKQTVVYDGYPNLLQTGSLPHSSPAAGSPSRSNP